MVLLYRQFFLSLLTVCGGINFVSGIGIDQVDDSELVNLLTKEHYVVTLFTKSKCPECDELENVLENIQKDLVDTLGAIVVKVQDSHLVGLYDPTKEPSLIFFRRGVPLLHSGAPNEEEILQLFSDNREPVVLELSDENFEHLTQAATGATTGDWFVFFYSADCVLCRRLYAVWETVGAKLKRQLNVARVNRLELGISTSKRFGITESPEFLFLRQGKVYRYRLKDYTPKSFVEFAEKGWRKQIHPEDVPPVPSIMNEMFKSQLHSVLENSNLVIVTITALTIMALVAGCIIKCVVKKPQTKESKSKKAK